MAPERTIHDLRTRELVTSDLGTTFLVEASAGTGKTRVLVDRYLRCVLDAERGAGDVRKVAAITFTEKAAAELRQRIREDLELRAQTAPAGSDLAARIAGALDALDDAPIGTIHGFAGRLLREFPVEARVDPAFEQLDELGAGLERERLWEEWIAGLATSDAAASPGRTRLSRLLRAGVRLDSVRTLAIGPKGVFGERYDLDPTTQLADQPDLSAGLGRLAGPLQALADFCAVACLDPSDKGYVAAADLVEACRRLADEPPADLDQLAAALYRLPVRETASAPGGAKGNWDTARGGKDALQLHYQALVAEVAVLRDAYAAFLTGLAVAVADEYSRWAGGTQLALGRLDFTDLLGCLRDLLKRDLGARRALQRRFRYVLVDEFQDTDPLQAEIVFFLCEHEPLATEWHEVVLEPGKLFVVGDPKQSIYRFRRADIAMYDQVKRLVAAQPAGGGAFNVISQNFRTTPAVTDWVNRVFDGVFESDRQEGRQPGYVPVQPFRPLDGHGGVAVLLGRPYTGAAGEAESARRDEAAAVASLLLEMHDGAGERWQVQDRAGAPAGAAESWRPIRWGDVALLFRATTGLETYEQAFRAAGVPYRVEGGKAYFSRREVDDALLCLRAVDDPSDGPAVYGALHSSLFGFSDDELLLFWAHGGRFDLYAAVQPEAHAEIVAALTTLRELHEQRTACEPHELVADLVRRTCASEFLAGAGPGAAQAIANLDKLIDRAEAFAGAGGGGLGAFLAWAAQAGDAAGEQESQVDDDGDVVHLLTIHKAKGLEFPVVVLIGGALGTGGGRGEPIVDRAARRLSVKLKVELPGMPPRDLEPREYTMLKEREAEMEASEMRRLLYVAATRARDRLVVACFGKLTNKDGSPSAVLLGPLAGVLPEPAAITEAFDHEGMLVLPPGTPPDREQPDTAPDGGPALAERAAWLRERQELLVRAARPALATSPSGLERVDEEVRTGGPGAPPGRARALALGSAVHRVMELCDLQDEGTLASAAAAAAAELGRPDLAEDAASLAAACWRSAPVRAAARAQAADRGAVHRELPLGALVGDVVVNGAVDLLYRDDGAWVVVDYKTDRADEPGVLLQRYSPQGAAYAVAAEAVLGRGAVREVVFVAARAGGLDVHVPVDDALRASAVTDIATAAGAGHAVAEHELTGEPVVSDHGGAVSG